MTTAAPTADERLASTGLIRRLLVRPEFGSIVGALLVFLFFAYEAETFRTARGAAIWLDYASLYGIMAVAVALLMIGGEFDLSAGVTTASVGLTIGIFTNEYGWNIWPAIALGLALALAIGLFNGVMVVTTKLPSFIVTLGTFLMLQGLNLGLTKKITGTVLAAGIDEAPGYEAASKLYASDISLFGANYPVSIVWWIGVTIVATWVLMRTRAGNWIFSSGGNALAARSVGVPVARTKILLFMTTATAAWLVGTIIAVRSTSVQASQGIGQEFIYIIAAVVGGCLLTGGYGSAIGASVGALIFGMAAQGIVFAGWNADWFQFFLGAMLLLATLTNNYVRKYAEERRK
jgi:simple sugar transport system permease protein